MYLCPLEEYRQHYCRLYLLNYAKRQNLLATRKGTSCTA
jgi:hypothetical protein